jgi:acetyl-CoA acetyltransferase
MARAFTQAGVTAKDMNLLSLYDCYTIMVASTLEDAGLCRPGEFGSLARTHGFSHDGEYPLNTHGGQLGFGQPDLAGGMTHVIEAVRQLRGEAGNRQIKNASSRSLQATARR